MANAGGKLGPSIKGKGDGSGAMSTRPASLPDHKVLSNRDKAQLTRARGQDGKWIENEQRYDTQANRRSQE
ncbi:hypothetical protein [Bosea sp. (in: a-proteobacteria)]|uniref:hypothetical protein n=1 Tax=Bosea sp. (in: a-proteobacteria) TaxID=1871050 RepID=UPI002FC69DF1